MTRATLETDLAPPSPGVPGSGGRALPSRRIWNPSRVTGLPGTQGLRAGARGSEAAEKCPRCPPRGRSPGGGFRNASRRGREGLLENGVPEGLSAASVSW